MMTVNELKSLAGVAGNCLTVYQPLRDNYSHVAKPETRIAAALQNALHLLEKKGFSPEECGEMMRPLEKVAANTDWSNRNGSVLMFRAPEFTMVSFWPEALPARVPLGPEFLVLPLLPGLLRQRDFWLLGLSINSVRLYRGTCSGLTEVELPAKLASNLRDDEAFDVPDRSLRGRSSAGPSSGSTKGVQFGTSSARESVSAYLHDYFKEVDRAIHPILSADPQPLILMGVQRELALYRKLNTYAHLLAEAVHGSPESVPVHMLFEKASALLPAYAERPTETMVRHMDEAASRGLLIWDGAAIIEAALDRQIEELIVSPGSPGFEQHEEAANWAALATIRSSGRVSILPSPQTTGGFAAILRFRKAPPNLVEQLIYSGVQAKALGG
jgi:hypothetical protein